HPASRSGGRGAVLNKATKTRRFRGSVPPYQIGLALAGVAPHPPFGRGDGRMPASDPRTPAGHHPRRAAEHAAPHADSGAAPRPVTSTKSSARMRSIVATSLRLTAAWYSVSKSATAFRSCSSEEGEGAGESASIARAPRETHTKLMDRGYARPGRLAMTSSPI